MTFQTNVIIILLSVLRSSVKAEKIGTFPYPINTLWLNMVKMGIKAVVSKVASLILNDGVRNDEFLLLTFSRAAKFELKKRIIQLL